MPVRGRGGVDVRVTIFGDKQFNRRLLGVGHRAGHARPVFDAMGHKILERQQEVFASSGASAGRPWAPLQPRTVASKRRRGSLTPERPLEDTGASREAWRYGDPGLVFEPRDDELRIGVKGEALEHSQFHQPDPQQRSVFPPLSERERADFIRDMQHWVVYGEVKY